MRYRSREDAGRTLAGLLAGAAGPGTLVLGVARGGVVVAAPIAAALHAELAPITAVKIRSAFNPELAIGAVTPDGVPLLDRDLAERLGMRPVEIAGAVAAAAGEARRRQQVFGPLPDMTGRPVVVVDDGVATGATLFAALAHVRRLAPGRLVCAIPVGPPDTVTRLAGEVDELVCPLRPHWFGAVGEFYDDFTQVSDAGVLSALGR